MDMNDIQQLLAPLFPGLMGIRLVEATPDRVVAEMDVRQDLCTTGGTLHGGAFMAFADTLGGVGAFMNLQPGQGTTTTDSSTKFMAGAKLGSTVRAVSLALHRGRTTMVWETRISNAEGKLCAQITQTQLVLAPRAAS
ncbi:MAG: hypothetical protein RIQ60_346 [Pseudomonadota bacterium]|jgi:uncharacterized protein (TIGR00369 family)